MMKKTWQEHDLEGSGLQSINLAYLKSKKDIRKAYLLTAFFPLGIHQFYLGQPKKGGIFIFLSLLLLAFANIAPFVSAIIGFIEVMLMFRDVKSMERIVSDFNKELKLNLSLQNQHAAPENYKGKYSDDDDNQKSSKQKILSFAEQEALINEISKRKKQD